MPIESQICNFGWKAINFKLIGIDNNYYSLDQLKGEKGTLVMFICNHCPYVQSITDRLVYETNALKKSGINSVAIMSNDVREYPEDSFDNMAVFAKKNNFSFPYLFDASQKIARIYDAKCTPDFFGFNQNLQLQYRGRLDSLNKNDKDYSNNKRELYNAMISISLSGIGPKEQKPSIGCSIKWKK